MNDAKEAVRDARRLKPVRFLARAGFAMIGLVHVMIGIIAIGIALRRGGEADHSGAFAQIAATPGGFVVLWAMAVGLCVLGAWLILGAFLLPPADSKRRVARIATECGKGVAYLLLGWASIDFALGHTSNASDDARTLSARLLAEPGGVIVLVLLGALLCGVGVYFLVKGVRRRFVADISMPRGTAGKAVTGLGVLGYTAKGIAVFIVGVLTVTAALTVDPSKSTGLDGALKALAELPFGQVILGVIGVGLIAYGVYGFVRTRLARL